MNLNELINKALEIDLDVYLSLLEIISVYYIIDFIIGIFIAYFIIKKVSNKMDKDFENHNFR